MSEEKKQQKVSLKQYDVVGDKIEKIKELQYYFHRQSDFWEWLETEKGLNNKELFDEFEKWESKQQC